MNKPQSLAKLRQKLESSSLPLKETATNLVFGEGDPDSNIYLLGEAPGSNEDALGKPFVGRAGKLLDENLESIGIKRSKVYISNIVRYRPPKNRLPKPAEIKAFEPFVDEEIAIINPQIIITLGRVALMKFLPGEKITQIHGKVKKTLFKNNQMVVLPMFHPAAALRSPDVKKLFVQDFIKNAKMLKSLYDHS